jgi:hypothetical protein
MEETEKTTYNMDRLFSLSAWISSLAWIFLAIGAFQVVGGTLQFIQNIPEIIDAGIIDNLALVLSYIGDFPKGFIWILVFFVAKVVSEAIYVLVDIELNTRHEEMIEGD